jgi:hypothetical protein
MKRFILSMISLAAVLTTLGTMPSYLPTAHAAPKPTIGTSASASTSTSSSSSSSIVSRSVIPTVINNVKVDGTVTIWAGVIGFDNPRGPMQVPIHLLANVVKDPSKEGIWNVTVTKLSFPWNLGTVFTLQDGKVGRGIFQPSTNAVSVTVPLQNKIPKDLKNEILQVVKNQVPGFLQSGISLVASKIPLVMTIQISLNTNGSIKTPTGRIIHGSPIDPDGRIAMVGSALHTGLFNLIHVQAWMQGTVSPWPLTNSSAPTKKITKHVS